MGITGEIKTLYGLLLHWSWKGKHKQQEPGRERAGCGKYTFTLYPKRSKTCRTPWNLLIVRVALNEAKSRFSLYSTELKVQKIEWRLLFPFIQSQYI